MCRTDEQLTFRQTQSVFKCYMCVVGDLPRARNWPCGFCLCKTSNNCALLLFRSDYSPVPCAQSKKESLANISGIRITQQVSAELSRLSPRMQNNHVFPGLVCVV